MVKRRRTPTNAAERHAERLLAVYEDYGAVCLKAAAKFILKQNVELRRLRREVASR